MKQTNSQQNNESQSTLTKKGFTGVSKKVLKDEKEESQDLGTCPDLPKQIISKHTTVSDEYESYFDINEEQNNVEEPSVMQEVSKETPKFVESNPSLVFNKKRTGVESNLPEQPQPLVKRRKVGKVSNQEWLVKKQEKRTYFNNSRDQVDPKITINIDDHDFSLGSEKKKDQSVDIVSPDKVLLKSDTKKQFAILA